MEVEKIDSKENFIRLVNQYQNLIFSICLKLTKDYFIAEDLAQETFISAYKNIDIFDGQSEKAWLCRIASNKCVDYLKAAERRQVPMLFEDMPEGEMTSENEPLKEVLNREVMKELKNCCEALSPPYRQVAISHFIEGKTAKEIATKTNVGLHTIQTQIYRAREMLKKSFRKEMLKE